MLEFIDCLKQSAVNLVYPDRCLHCENKLEKTHRVLCARCFSELCFTCIKERCKRCFAVKNADGDHPFCAACYKRPSPFLRVLFPLELQPESYSLRKTLHRPASSFLTKAMAAFMTLYFLEQKLPWPDIIVPLNDPFAKKAFKGRGLAFELGNAISYFLSVPTAQPLIPNGIFSCDSFDLKKNHGIENKKVLLIGEKHHPLFFEAGDVLLEAGPQALIGLGLFTE